MKLYEYSVYLKPKYDDKGNKIEKEEVIVPVTAKLADDDDQAQLLAARAIPEEQMENLDRLTVVVRPF